MSFDPARAALIGQISLLKQRRLELATRASAKLAAAEMLMVGHRARRLRDIDVEGASIHLSEAAELKREYMEVEADLSALDPEWRP